MKRDILNLNVTFNFVNNDYINNSYQTEHPRPKVEDYDLLPQPTAASVVWAGSLGRNGRISIILGTIREVIE